MDMDWKHYSVVDVGGENTETMKRCIFKPRQAKRLLYLQVQKTTVINLYWETLTVWIATEINEHYDSDDSRSSFVKVCMARQLAAKKVNDFVGPESMQPKTQNLLRLYRQLQRQST